MSQHTIRFYEKEGLLPAPRRTPSQYRVYGDGDASRLLFIRQAQALGLTVEDIRELVRNDQLRTRGQCRRVAGLLGERIEALDKKLAELKTFRRQLAESLERCEKADGDACPVVLDLARRGPADGGSRRDASPGQVNAWKRTSLPSCTSRTPLVPLNGTSGWGSSRSPSTGSSPVFLRSSPSRRPSADLPVRAQR